MREAAVFRLPPREVGTARRLWLAILLAQDDKRFFGVVTVAERTFMTGGGTFPIAAERNTLVQVHSIIGIGRKRTIAEGAFELRRGWSGRIHDIACGLKDMILNDLALVVRNFLNFQPLGRLSNPVIWVGVAEISRTTRDLEIHGASLRG